MIPFTAISHTADIELQVVGTTQKELFKHAVIGMFQVIRPQTDQSDCYYEATNLVCTSLPMSHEIVIEAEDIDMLLIDFLSEALYLSDVHNEAYLDVVIHELTATKIHATLYGIPIHGFEEVEIKAVTYHGLKIIKNNEGMWQVNIVFDI